MKNSIFQHQYRRQLATQSVFSLSGTNWLKQCMLFLVFYSMASVSFGITYVDGVMNGNAGANERGAVSFQYQIDLPPGINEHTPDLTFMYNSQNTDRSSTMGVGWAMAFNSIIYRCGKSVVAEQGDRTGAFDVDSGGSVDRLCMDGQTLLSTTGFSDANYWNHSANDYYMQANTTEYKIKVDSWDASTDINSPISFTVTDRKGNTFRYGSTIESRSSAIGGFTGSWALSEVKDMNGNITSYYHTLTDNVSTISGIVYGQTYIYFYYTTLPTENTNAISGYIGSNNSNGFAHSSYFEVNKQLDKIHVTQFTGRTNIYNFEYDTSVYSRRDRLISIEKCTSAVAITTCISPKVTFSYYDIDSSTSKKFTFFEDEITSSPRLLGGIGNGMGGTFDGLSQQMAPDNIFVAGSKVIPGDWNGDGRTDFMRQGASGNYALSSIIDRNLEIFLADDTNAAGSTTWDIATYTYTDNQGKFQSLMLDPDDADADDHLEFKGFNIIPGDYNGDGKLDFIKQGTGTNASNYIDIFMVYTNIGNDINGHPQFNKLIPSGVAYQTDLAGWHQYDQNNPGGGIDAYTGTSLYPGDFNGDGKTDFVKVEAGSWANNVSNNIVLYLANNMTGIDGTFSIHTMSGDLEARFRDSFPNLGNWNDLNGVNLQLGDFNGDGKTDILRQETGAWAWDRSETLCVFLSTGTTFESALCDTSNHTYPNPFNGGFSDEINTFDVNMQSLLGRAYQDSISRANTNGFLTGSKEITRYWSIAAVDLNNDGQTDILARENWVIPFEVWDETYMDGVRVYLSTGDGKFTHVDWSRGASNQSVSSEIHKRAETFRATMVDWNIEGLGYPAKLQGKGLGSNAVTLIDVDGDGILDILSQKRFSTDYYCYDEECLSFWRGLGDGTFDFDVEDSERLISNNMNFKTHGLHVKNYGDINNPSADVYHEVGSVSFMQGDFDGDGRQDIMAQSQGVLKHTVPPGSDLETPDLALWYNRASTGTPHADLMKSATVNRLTTEMTYGVTTSSDFESTMGTTNSGYSWVNSRIENKPIHVVKTLTRSPESPTNDISDDITNFYYGEPVGAMFGGFLGFTVVETTNAAKNLKNTRLFKTMEVNNIYAHVLTSASDAALSTGELIKKTAYEKYIFATNVGSTSGVYSSPVFAFTHQLTEKMYFGANYLETTLVNTYDGDFNVLGQRRTIGDSVHTELTTLVTLTNGHVVKRVVEHCSNGTLSGGIALATLSCDAEDVFKKTVVTHDAVGNPESTKEYSNATDYLTTTHTYNSNGTIETETVPNGTVTSYLYDAYGNSETTTVDPSGINLVMTRVFDTLTGVPIQEIDPNGRTVKSNVDALGRLMSIEREVVGSTLVTTEDVSYKWEYDVDLGYIFSKKRDQYNGDGSTYSETESLNVLGKKVQKRIVSASDDDFVERWKYDFNGNTLSHSQMRNTNVEADFVVNYIYDVAGRLKDVDYPNGEDSTLAYEVGHANCSEYNNVVHVTKTRKNKVEYSCMTLGSKSLKVGQDGATLGISWRKFEYDELQRLTKLIDNAGLETLITYDWLNRKTRMEHPQHGLELSHYDPITGEKTKWEHKDLERLFIWGNVEYSYDALGRQKTVTHSSDGLETVLEYDSGLYANNKGRLSKKTLTQNTVQVLQEIYAYTNDGQISHKSTAVGGQTYVSSYSHDWQGKAKKLTSASGQVIDYSYNANGTIDSVTTSDGISAFSGYLGHGKYTTASYANAVNETRVFNAYRQLTDVTITKGASTLLDSDFTYNGYGDVLGVTDNQTPSNNITYGYGTDRFSRHVSSLGPWGAEPIIYDLDGNIKAKGNVIYTYDSLMRLEKTSDGTMYDNNDVGSVANIAWAVPEANVALGATVTGSSSHTHVNLYKMIDGSISDFDDNAYHSTTGAVTGGYIEVSLSQVRNLAELKIVNMKNNKWKITNYTLSGYNSSGNPISGCSWTGTTQMGQPEIIPFACSNVKKIRFTNNGNSDFNITEFEAYEPIVNNRINRALNKSVTKSSGVTGANLAVDGNVYDAMPEAANAPGGNYAVSSSGANQWIKVDLGANYNLEEVKVYNRTGHGWRIKDYTIEYLDSNSNVVASETIVGTKALYPSSILLSGTNVRYLRFTNHAGAGWYLPELEAYEAAEFHTSYAYNAHQNLTKAVVNGKTTTFAYYADGKRFAKHNHDGTSVYYIDKGLEVVRNGSNQTFTDNIIGPEGRFATITSTASPAMLVYQRHDKLADMYNVWSVQGLMGWVYHSAAKIVTHPKTLDALGLAMAVMWLLFVALFVRNQLRSLRAVQQGEDDVYGTEFMRNHRGLSSGAPLALAGMLAFSTIMTPGFIETAVAGANGNPDYGVQYFHHDRVGSTRLVTNSSGTVDAKPIYMPFGEVYNNTDDDSYRYGFGGKETDHNTGLMYFEARYYNPKIGRFISTDTMVIGSDVPRSTELNRYAYSQNDPINMKDPSGNFAFIISVMVFFWVQVAINFVTHLVSAGGNFKKIDWKSFGISVGVALAMSVLVVGGVTATGAALTRVLITTGRTMGGFAKAMVVTAVTAPINSAVGQGLAMAKEGHGWSWGRYGIGIAIDFAFAGALSGVRGKISAWSSESGKKIKGSLTTEQVDDYLDTVKRLNKTMKNARKEMTTWGNSRASRNNSKIYSYAMTRRSDAISSLSRQAASKWDDTVFMWAVDAAWIVAYKNSIAKDASNRALKIDPESDDPY